jgi:hypothetical protein
LATLALLEATGISQMLREYPSMKRFKARCHWWLPASPTHKVPGLVGYDGTNILAELDTSTPPPMKADDETIDTLHAEMIDGTELTIFNSFIKSRASNIKLVVNLMGVGAHLSAITDQRFDRAHAKFRGLNSWWEPKQIDVEDKAGRSIAVCEPPASMPFLIPSRAATVALGQYSTRQERQNSYAVKYFNLIQFSPDSPQSFEWFRKLIEEVREFLTLLFDQDAALIGLSFAPTGRDYSMTDVEWFWNRQQCQKTAFDRFRAISFQDVERTLGERLTTWLSNNDQRRRSRALFFSNTSSPAPFLESRFLPVVQALEVYCRAFVDEKYVPDSDFVLLQETLTKSIPNDTKAELRQRLKTSIGLSNELSLGDRILARLNSLAPNVCQLVCDCPKRFTKLLKDSRNYYTHYGDVSSGVLSPGELYWATEQASLLLRILLLKDAGFTDESILNWLSQSRYRAHSKKMWSELENKERSKANNSVA